MNKPNPVPLICFHLNVLSQIKENSEETEKVREEILQIINSSVNLTEEECRNISICLQRFTAPSVRTFINSKDQFILLAKMIEQISELQYEKIKKDLTYPSIDKIIEFINNSLQGLTDTNKELCLELTSLKLSDYIYKNPSFEEKNKITTYLDQLVDSYLSNKELPATEALKTQFANFVMNEHRNIYISQTIHQLTSELKLQLPLTKESSQKLDVKYKINLIEVGKIKPSLRTKKQVLSSTATNPSALRIELKKFQKQEPKLTDEVLTQLDQLFLEDKLTPDQLTQVGLTNPKLIKGIIYKYKEALAQELSSTSYQRSRLYKQYRTEAISKLPLTKENFIITTEAKYNVNLANFLYHLASKDQSRITLDFQLNEFPKLLSLANLFKSYQLEDFNNIFSNLKDIQTIVETERLKHRLKNQQDEEAVTPISLITNWGKFISYAHNLTSENELIRTIFPDSLIPILRTNKRANLTDYALFYLEMIKRNLGTFPGISGKYQDVEYISGDYYNIERLIIRDFGNSCIDLNDDSEGANTFNCCLIGDYLERNPEEFHLDDVLYFRKNNQIIARAIVTRKDNHLAIAPIINREGQIAHSLYQKDLLEEIGHKFLEQTTGDNLEYVLLSTNGLEDSISPSTKNIDSLTSFEQVAISHFELGMHYPHADWKKTGNQDGKFLVVAQTPQKINYSNQTSKYYFSNREPIKISVKPDAEVATKLSRIKALAILNITNEKERKKAIRNYKKVTPKDYKKVIFGQDWYIGLTRNNQFEQQKITVIDGRQKLEINQAQTYLNNNDLISKLETRNPNGKSRKSL